MALSYIILIAVLGTHGALKCFYRNAHVFRGKKNGQRERERKWGWAEKNLVAQLCPTLWPQGL